MSRTDSTIDDWLGVEEETNPAVGQETVTAAQWDPKPPRCQCGAELSNWHDTASARRIVRVYGDDDGEVPACPSCVDWSPNGGDRVLCVTRAIRAMERKSTIERRNPKAAALDDGQQN